MIAGGIDAALTRISSMRMMIYDHIDEVMGVMDPQLVLAAYFSFSKFMLEFSSNDAE